MNTVPRGTRARAHSNPYHRPISVLALLALLVTGCGDEPGTDPVGPSTPTGSVAIQATTTGDPGAIDRSGYTVMVGSANQTVMANGSVTVTGVSVGDVAVSLADVASNCTASSTSETVTVTDGGTATASFSVDCATDPGIARWFADIGGELNGTSVGTDGKIYAPSADAEGVLFALDPDGSEAWSFTADDGIAAPPSVHSDGSLYFGTSTGFVYALDADGTELWSTNLSGVFGVGGAPAIAGDGTQYWSNDNFLDAPTLTAMSPTGTVSWSYSDGGQGSFSGPVVADDGTVYAGLDRGLGGTLVALDPAGVELWSYDTDGRPTAAAIGSDGTVYFGGVTSLVGGNPVIDGKLYAVGSDGSLTWTFPTGGVIERAPAIGADGTIYVISGTMDLNGDPDVGRLHAVNSDGTESWSVALDGCAGAGPTVGADGTIYAPVAGCRFGGSGVVEAFDATGSPLWVFEIFGEFKVVDGSVPIAVDGTMYVASQLTGEVYAVRTESMGLAASAWPKPGHDNQNSRSALGGS